MPASPILILGTQGTKHPSAAPCPLVNDIFYDIFYDQSFKQFHLPFFLNPKLTHLPPFFPAVPRSYCHHLLFFQPTITSFWLTTDPPNLCRKALGPLAAIPNLVIEARTVHAATPRFNVRYPH